MQKYGGDYRLRKLYGSCSECDFVGQNAVRVPFFCRRYPPVLMPDGKWGYPAVREEEVCGEFRKANHPMPVKI